MSSCPKVLDTGVEILVVKHGVSRLRNISNEAFLMGRARHVIHCLNLYTVQRNLEMILVLPDHSVLPLAVVLVDEALVLLLVRVHVLAVQLPDQVVLRPLLPTYTTQVNLN